jgi:methylmalonyl-CoA mutase N-terminal domain/subunit
VWARLLKERYGATDPRSQQLRIFAFTAGSTLTAQQPLNNVSRATVEAMSAALAGVQTMHVSAYDEALGVPTEQAATLALRTQQVVAFETGVADTVDPLAGSYAVEALTDDLERRIWEALDDVEARGGTLACIASGFFAEQLSDAAYDLAREVESGERVVVGVNRYPARTEPLEVFQVDPGMEASQVAAVQAVRDRRDAARVEAALAALGDAARAGENVVPACVEAVTAYGTVGEIVTVLRQVHGDWQPAVTF